ncbi:uncharacterized protein LOC107003818 [Solanum pennellii]|uniref:Uncharacterized protein LOC107003818 n=1 Tax=Solanum pennellii TaxID=28526 RepID=A0ABM1FJ19_SOLPN|nr:uncharacterized protein LOC107003818 [Solanum pennellii]
MNTTSFTASNTSEDPENFVEKLKKVFEVMHVVNVERVQLVAYQLKSVARTWFDQWKGGRAEDAPHPSWACFEKAFLGSKKGRVAMLIGDIHISKLMVSVEKVEEEKLMDRDEYMNKIANPRNESRQQKGVVGITLASVANDQTENCMRECPKSKQCGRNGGNRDQSSSAAPPDRVAPRGATSGTSGGTNRLYALNNCQENLPNIVTEPGVSLSFVTPYVAMNLKNIPEQLRESFNVSTPTGEFILFESVYHDCPI